jgi:hypothetical protein
MRARRGPLRRSLLGALALAAFGAPALASGCAGGFAPPSQVDGLRVLSVQADKPYGVDCEPCEPSSPGATCEPTCTLAKEVTFRMTHADGLDPESPRPLQIVWLGGCFDPAGDAYYACYPQLASLLQGFDVKKLLASGLVGLGDTFTLPLPPDLISRRPQPPSGAPYYGVAYVFFAVCAGTLGPVPPEGDGSAGSFPIGCFDAKGNRLGADSFVPGYTQIYAFSDLRPNGNPVVTSLLLDGRPLRDGATAETCGVSIDDRLAPPSCGKPDAFGTCAAYDLDVVVPDDVADVDPDGTSSDGSPLHEVVWVDYFADQGSLDTPVKLVSDATTGILHNHGVRWIGPPPRDDDAGSAPIPVNLWAVVHDARGGETVIHRTLQVR